MDRYKIMRVYSCIDCPVAECTKEGVWCNNATMKDKEYVGSIEHVVNGKIIPDWCPLDWVK